LAKLNQSWQETSINQKKELLLVAMFVGQMEPYEEALESILNRCFLPSLVPFGQGVSGEKICLTLAGSIYVRSSIKFLRFIPFGQQIWLPRAILVSDWLMLNK
jgi:hypothetical protein